MMGAMDLRQLAHVVNGSLKGENVSFSNICTDTRSLQKGDLFFVLKGDSYDANDFIENAKASGAVAAVVSKDSDVLPTVLVDDTTAALGKLAQAVRMKADAPVVAITGSNGKTSVKEMLLAILKQSFNVLATEGNLNNHIGVPLTLLRLTKEHQVAIIEMGASHAGEIAYLCELAKPNFSVINNIGEAHLEGFGSVEGIANAKAEIVEGLSANGVAILNQEDAWYETCLEKAVDRSVLSFGWSDNASVWSEQSNVRSQLIGGRFEISFTLHYQQQFVDVQLNLLGDHNVLNALAAASLAIALGVSLPDIATGLAKVEPVAGRMQPLVGVNDSLIVNDCYNASPTSFKAALSCVVGLDKPVWLVLGDFAELGKSAAEIHQQLAGLIANEKVERVFAVGEYMKLTVEALNSREEGKRVVAEHFTSKAALSGAVKRDLEIDCVVLVKGSRSQGLEDVVGQLVKQEETPCC